MSEEFEKNSEEMLRFRELFPETFDKQIVIQDLRGEEIRLPNKEIEVLAKIAYRMGNELMNCVSASLEEGSNKYDLRRIDEQIIYMGKYFGFIIDAQSRRDARDR